MAESTTPDDTIYLDPATGTYVDADGNPVDVEEVDDTNPRFGSLFRRDPDADAKRQADKERRARERLLRDRGNARRRKYVMWGVIAVIVLCLFSFLKSCNAASESSVRSIVSEELNAHGNTFPTGQAIMWSGQVLTTWATWDESKAKARQTLLAPFLSQGMDDQAGWNGKGTQQVMHVSINPEPDVLNANRALIFASYMVGDGTWRCVTLKVFATKPKSFSTTALYAFSLAGNPTPTSCTPTTGAPQLPAPSNRTDQAAARDLQNNFYPGFFAAWASSDQATLGQFLDDGVRTVGLGGAFRSDPKPQITAVSVPIEGQGNTAGDTTTASVTVVWTLPDGNSQTTATYNVPMHRKGGQWFVAGEPAASAQDPSVSGNAAANNGAQAENNGGSTNGDNNPTDGSSVYPTPSTTTPPTPTTYAPGGITDSTAPSTTATTGGTP